MKPILITVTYNTWETYTERLIRMVLKYTDPYEIHGWVIVDNNSGDWTQLKKLKNSAVIIPWLESENIGDIPRYNREFRYYEARGFTHAIALSTDVRLLSKDWVQQIMRPFEDPQVAMVGRRGPGGMGPQHADPSVGGTWHWVPKLLVDRGIEFADCSHAQTHFFAVDLKKFVEVGGFWEPEDCNFLEKSNLIAGEVSLGTRLTAAGYKLEHHMPPHHHYGNQAVSQGDLDEFDRNAGWEVDF
jgi:hypothetical protein